VSTTTNTLRITAYSILKSKRLADFLEALADEPSAWPGDAERPRGRLAPTATAAAKAGRALVVSVSSHR
jgi:hypothetical protein